MCKPPNWCKISLLSLEVLLWQEKMKTHKKLQFMRDMMSVLLEGALDEKLDEELGHSKKTMHTSYGDMDFLK